MPLQSYAKPAYKKAQRAITLEYIRSFKESSCCELCGESATVCLDFHHRTASEKSFSLSDAKDQTFDAIKAEIRKCAVVCANCHRVIHSQNRIKAIEVAPEEDYPLFTGLDNGFDE